MTANEFSKRAEVKTYIKSRLILKNSDRPGSPADSSYSVTNTYSKSNYRFFILKDIFTNRLTARELLIAESHKSTTDKQYRARQVEEKRTHLP